MAVFTQYSDPSSGATTVDGAVARTGKTDADWATLRAGAGDTALVSRAEEVAFYWVANADATWNSLYRFIATFDLSSIAGATVSAITLSIYPFAKGDPYSVAPDLNVYGATPAANNNLAAADYGQTGATAYCDTPITYANFNVASPAYQDFVFNAAGIAAVQAAIDAETKVFKLSLKNANKDVANSEPTKGTSATYMEIETADKGTTYRPRLVITYTGKSFSGSDTIALSETRRFHQSSLLKDTIVFSETLSKLKGMVINLIDTLSLSDLKTLIESDIWDYFTKKSASWINPDKNSATWVEPDKNSASWNNPDKNSATWVEPDKNSASWNNQNKS